MDADHLPPLVGVVPPVLHPIEGEWRYVPVRRRLLFLEHSISVGLQWVVFEPNTEELWQRVVSTVSDFLMAQWQAGLLQGSTAREAFFVRCDRTTMTQDDLDTGRLVVLIGLATIKPAEFVVFRIGQWTADPDC
jgi:phage tail sheath protein FI